MRERNKILIALLIILMIGFVCGYVIGFSKGINWAVDIGLNLIDFEVDEKMIKQGIFNYKNNINNCFNEDL